MNHKKYRSSVRQHLLFAALVSAPLSAANIFVGSGSSESFYVIEAPSFGVLTYQVAYDHNPASPLSSSDLLRIIDLADSNISFDISDFGDATQPNEFLSSITYLGNTLAFDGTNYWAQWVAGGEAGAQSTPPFAPDPQVIPGNAWSFGSGLSINYRNTAPGSWDALVYGDSAAPSVQPVPEPSGLILSFAAATLLLWPRRRRV